MGIRSGDEFAHYRCLITCIPQSVCPVSFLGCTQLKDSGDTQCKDRSQVYMSGEISPKAGVTF